MWARLGEQEEGTRSKVPVPRPLMVVVGYSIHEIKCMIISPLNFVNLIFVH